MPRFLVYTCLSLLAACSSDPPPRPLPSAYYACQNGIGLYVEFAPDAANVKLPDGTLARLPQQRAASGMWYRSAQYELRGKGDDATWTARGVNPTECTVK